MKTSGESLGACRGRRKPSLLDIVITKALLLSAFVYLRQQHDLTEKLDGEK
jgi:hypothetical protein